MLLWKIQMRLYKIFDPNVYFKNKYYVAIITTLSKGLRKIYKKTSLVCRMNVAAHLFILKKISSTFIFPPIDLWIFLPTFIFQVQEWKVFLTKRLIQTNMLNWHTRIRLQTEKKLEGPPILNHHSLVSTTAYNYDNKCTHSISEFLPSSLIFHSIK